MNVMMMMMIYLYIYVYNILQGYRYNKYGIKKFGNCKTTIDRILLIKHTTMQSPPQSMYRSKCYIINTVSLNIKSSYNTAQ